ncbi:MAG: FecR domain-containing protein [Caulobacterales bacterium]|nr:FecR domain-containing protein [Caulobacterales bacterium]
MIPVWRNDEDARREHAAAWVVRLEAGDLSEAEAIAFDGWLCEAPQNATAFDAALEVSQAYARRAAPITRLLSERRLAPMRRGVDRRVVMGAGAMAAAAAAAVVIAPELRGPSPGELYATAKGVRRRVQLADGSTVDLNAGTRLTVRFDGDARHVSLDGGQAVFDVAHDAARPFLIAAGDRTIRVVGTQFDVRRRDGRLAVTVARGAVEVRPAEGARGKAYRLHPGQRLEHVEGAPDALISAAEAEDVLAWRTGRLVYRGQPLGEVVADLNEQFPTPIRIEDPSLAAEPISGVLVLDNQAAVIRRLALLVPIRTVRSGAGVVLRRDAVSGR